MRKALPILFLFLTLTTVVSPMLVGPQVALAREVPDVTSTEAMETLRKQNALAAAQNADSCEGIFWDSLTPSCIVKRLLIVFYEIALAVLGKAVAFFGTIFDFLISISIVQFSVLGNSDFVKIGWGIIRDVCNLFFIFVLLYLAIRTILGQEGQTMKAVVRVVICALLINFSLAGVRMAIDSSNILTLVFYNASKSGPGDGTLSASIMNAVTPTKSAGLIKPPPAFNPKDPTREPTEAEVKAQSTGLVNQPLMSVILSAFFGLFFIFMVCMLLLVISLMFFVRMVTLIWLMVTSPWPVLSYAMFGSSTGSAHEWWESLMGQLLFAPVFFILFYIALQMATEINKTDTLHFTAPTGVGWAADAGGTTIKFLIIIFMLFAALLYAKKHGGETGGKIASWGEGKIKDYSKRSGAWMGRNTLGRAGQAVGDNRVTRALAERQGIGGVVGRLGLRAGAGAAGVGFGVKGGSLHDTREAGAKAKEARNKELGQVDDVAVQAETLRAQADPAGYRTRHMADVVARENTRRRDAGGVDMTVAEQATFETSRMTNDAIAADTRTRHKARATARQESYQRSLTTGPLGATFHRAQGSRLAPASSYLALSRMRTSNREDTTRQARVDQLTARVATLQAERETLAPGGVMPPAGHADRLRIQEVDREIFQLEGQLINANDAAAAARARTAAGAAPTP